MFGIQGRAGGRAGCPRTDGAAREGDKQEGLRRHGQAGLTSGTTRAGDRQRGPRGHKGDSQHRSDMGKGHKRLHLGSLVPTDTPNTRAYTRSVHRCTQHLSLEHTPPPSPAPAWMLTHQLPLTLSHNPQLESLHTSSTSVSYTRTRACRPPFTPLSHPGTPVSLHLPCSAPATGPQGSGCWTPGWIGRSSAR